MSTHPTPTSATTATATATATADATGTGTGTGTGTTIAEQVRTFDEGFSAQIGPELTATFAGEQADLRAAGVPATAVTEGTPLPDARLLDPTGSEVALAGVLGDSGTVLVFYRGAWCPYCNITLRTYQQELLPALRERGVGLVAISPQTPDGSERAVEGGELAFTVLSDPGNALVRELGLLTEPSADAQGAHAQLGFDVADSNADATREVPYPTVLVVDGVGVVRSVDVHADYTTRTEVADVLTAVDALRGPR